MCFQSTWWDRHEICIPIPKGDIGRRKEWQVPSKFKFLTLDNTPLWPDVLPSTLVPHAHSDQGRKGLGRWLGTSDLVTPMSNFLHAPFTPQATKLSSRFTVLRHWRGCLSHTAQGLTGAQIPIIPTSGSAEAEWLEFGEKRPPVNMVENRGSRTWALNDQFKVLKKCPTLGLLTCAPFLAFEELTRDSSTPGTWKCSQYFSIYISKQDLLQFLPEIGLFGLWERAVSFPIFWHWIKGLFDVTNS